MKKFWNRVELVINMILFAGVICITGYALLVAFFGLWFFISGIVIAIGKLF